MNQKSLLIFFAGKCRKFDIPPRIRAACRNMPKEFRLYIGATAPLKLAPIQQLVLTRARANGVHNAITKMKEAARGKRAKRAPIKVKRAGSKLLVLDGNSTVIVLAAAGVRIVPVTTSSR